MMIFDREGGGSRKRGKDRSARGELERDKRNLPRCFCDKGRLHAEFNAYGDILKEPSPSVPQLKKKDCARVVSL